MIIHPPKEPAPLFAGLAVIEQKVRAVLVGRMLALPWPMVMRHDMTQGDALLLHQDRCELRCPLKGHPTVAAAVLAHFDADREAVSRAMEIRMLTLLADRHVLDRLAIIDGEVPNEITNAVAVFGLWRSQRSTLERDRMLIGIRAVILRAVNRDVPRPHRPHDFAAMAAARDHVGAKIHLAIHPRNRSLAAR